MSVLLITNDYPPKVGGIQVYLWELFRRLPAEKTCVYTRRHEGYEKFDSEQEHQIIRDSAAPLLPTPKLIHRLNKVIGEIKPDLAIIDPALPLGLVGRKLHCPYGLVIHGAEATIPTQLPTLRQGLQAVVSSAELVISASDWATAMLKSEKIKTPFHYIPPGVDTERFRPLSKDERLSLREKFGISESALVLLSVSRLVPRKGMDTLIKSAATLHGEFPSLQLVIAGSGRYRKRLEVLAKRLGAPVMFLGRVLDEDLPLLYGTADIFAMLCRERWGGLEQEGFGLVFLEAAAAGIPQIAGHSGGAAEAVEHEETGFVVPAHRPNAEIISAVRKLASDASLREQMGIASRQRAVAEFSYDLLAKKLEAVLF